MWRCAALILWPRLLTMYAYLMILRSISFWNCKVSFTCSISECVKLLEIWFYIIVRALSWSYTQSVCRSVLVHFFVFGWSKISLNSTSKFQEVLWWFDLVNLFSRFTVISIGFPRFFNDVHCTTHYCARNSDARHTTYSLARTEITCCQ